MNHEQRDYLAQYLDLIEITSKTHLGYVCDISEAGLMFITELVIPTNVVKDVYIQNKIISDDIPELFIRAKIKTLWEKPNINPKLLCIGCRILEIDTDDHQRLNDLASALSYDHNIEIHRTSHS